VKATPILLFVGGRPHGCPIVLPRRESADWDAALGALAVQVFCRILLSACFSCIFPCTVMSKKVQSFLLFWSGREGVWGQMEVADGASGGGLRAIFGLSGSKCATFEVQMWHFWRSKVPQQKTECGTFDVQKCHFCSASVPHKKRQSTQPTHNQQNRESTPELDISSHSTFFLAEAAVEGVFCVKFS